MSLTKNGVAAGKKEIDYQGSNRVVYDDITINDYVSGGVAYDATAEGGLSRLDYVDVHVKGTDNYIARYDYASDTVVLLNTGGGGEVADATTVDVDVRIRMEGSG